VPNISPRNGQTEVNNLLLGRLNGEAKTEKYECGASPSNSFVTVYVTVFRGEIKQEKTAEDQSLKNSLFAGF
jgi:hypothetical protein